MLTAATYNVHSWRDRHGQKNIENTLAVIRGLQADVLALQEVTLRSTGSKALRLGHLEHATGMRAVPGMNFRRKNTNFGNVLLSAHPIKAINLMDLRVGNREPRGAILATLDVRGTAVRVIATHLGLRGDERRMQLKQILFRLQNRYSGITILMGDLNEWNPFSLSMIRLYAHLGPIWSPPTFPSRYPVFALDRILVKPRIARKHIKAIKTFPTVNASDHLPVVAGIDLSP